MGRKQSGDDLLKLFDDIRTMVPEAVLRTTLIVGFPGETRKDADELLRFVQKVRFDHLGVFTYSDADDLPSHRLSGHVPPKTARRRFDRIMSAQATISEKNNEKYIDRELEVLVEESPEENVFVGRAWFQAPEVDGVVYIRNSDERFSKRLDYDIGSLVRVKIVDAMEYDLVGEPA
jgi:ribosomal protein S12 methylthiotransferase